MSQKIENDKQDLSKFSEALNAACEAVNAANQEFRAYAKSWGVDTNKNCLTLVDDKELFLSVQLRVNEYFEDGGKKLLLAAEPAGGGKPQ